MKKEKDEKVKKAHTRTEKTKRQYLSSIHFKKTIKTTGYDQTRHNDRTQSPNYLIDGDYEVSCSYEEALKEKQRMIDEAKEAYGKGFHARSYEWSAVVNITPDTKMEQLKELTQYFFKEYGFQCYQIAIHRDEGHIDEKGEKIINHHAHLEFITLDRQTGQNRFQRRHIGQVELRKIQSEVAEKLEMKRGTPKLESGIKRIEPRKYAQMKEKEKETLKELKQELSKEKRERKEGLKECFKVIEQFRKDCIGNGYTKDFYDDLSRLKKDKEKLKEIINDPRPTKKLLEETLKTLAETHKKALKEKDKEIEKLKKEIENIKDLKELEKPNYLHIFEKITERPPENIDDLKKLHGNEYPNFITRDAEYTTQNLRKENKALKEQLSQINAQNEAKNAKEPLNDKKLPKNIQNDLKGEDLEKITGLAIEKLDKKLKGFSSNDTVIVKEEDRQKSLKEFNDAYDILSRLNPEKLKEWKQKKENLNYRSSLENYKKKPLHGQGIKTYDGFSKHLPEHLKHKPQSQGIERN